MMMIWAKTLISMLKTALNGLQLRKLALMDTKKLSNISFARNNVK